MKPLISIFVTGGLMLSLSGCFGNSGESKPASSSAQTPEAGEPETPPAESDPQASTPDHTEQTDSKKPASSSICDVVPPSALTTLTGVKYSTAKSTANFPTIKHCEYFSDDVKYSVSLLIAFDASAKQRMDQNRQYPGIVAIDNLGDEAIWEPAQGTLTVLKGNRCTEIRLSKAHGDEKKRQSLAAKISALIFEKF